MSIKNRIVFAIGALALLAILLTLALTGRLSAEGGVMPKGLPPWFKDLDKDENGQITLHEWRAGGKKLSEFRDFDLNHDGLITAEEVLQVLNRPFELTFEGCRAEYRGAIEETDEKYRGRKCYRIFTVRMEQGKTYQIDHMSKAFDAYLYLEDSEGELLAENDDGGEGLNSRIIFRAETTAIYRLIATSVGSRPGVFSFSVRVLNRFGGIVPSSLPAWFNALDKDEDGQISLHEWRTSGKTLSEFRAYDLNNDGFITAEEVVQVVTKPSELKLDGGGTTYKGVIEAAVEERYRGKKSFKIFTIKMEQGKTYEINHISKDFQAFLHLEDSDGNQVQQNSSRTIGENSRITFQADTNGTFRLIATSLGGFRTGAFSLSVRVLNRFGGPAPKGLPSWFKILDKDEDGQVSLHEWRRGGKKLSEFREYDLNDDGFITAEEILRVVKRPFELKSEGGLAYYNGAIEEADEPYRGKKSFKIFSIKMEQGRVYEIDYMSQAFYAYLYLENSAGEILDKNNSGGKGQYSRIVHRAAMTGNYRLVATSQDGYKTGEFSLSIRVRN
jgi:Ca2+-binding EF-hand superfamily protein